MLTTCHLTK